MGLLFEITKLPISKKIILKSGIRIQVTYTKKTSLILKVFSENQTLVYQILFEIRASKMKSGGKEQFH